jgi:hypothetical protein
MRTSFSEILARGLLRILEKVEFEEEEHPRDASGRWAPKGAGAVAVASGVPWVEGRGARDIERQVRLEKERVEAIDKISNLINTGTMLSSPDVWNDLTDDEKQKAKEKYVSVKVRDTLVTEAQREFTDKDYGDIGRRILDSGGFQKIRNVLTDKDFKDVLTWGAAHFELSNSLVERGVPLVMARDAESFLHGNAFREAVTREAITRIENLPPQLKDEAKTEAETTWGDMIEEDWMAYARRAGVTGPRTVRIEEPQKYNLVDSEDDPKGYAKTRKFANGVVNQRFKDVLLERKIRSVGLSIESVSHFDSGYFVENVWNAWKESSGSDSSLLFQHAAALELGANSRIHESRIKDMDPEELKITRAYVRAQWETTQFLLSRSGETDVSLYRAVILEEGDIGKKAVGGAYYNRLPEIRLQQNGLSSWTADPEVANSWDGMNIVAEHPIRVVLRARVPATAVFSLPVHGKNIASEKEVVVAGTPWKAWDAWETEAPRFVDVPLEKDKGGPIQQHEATEKGFVVDLNDPKIAGKEHWLKPKTKGKK